ncbi:MAG: TM2 domain-containing protein [Bacteroidota bacterium]
METYQNPYMSLPGISAEELAFLQQATAGLNDGQKRSFYLIYAGKRKSPQDMLMFSVIGLCLIPGFQRFITGQIGMGILYLFTLGLCFVGSIMDLVNHKKLAIEFNEKMAIEAFNIAKLGQ